VADRSWFRPVWDATDQPAVLTAYAGVCTLIAGRAAPIFETVRRAADATPEAAEIWDTLQRNRRAGARMVVDRLLSMGPLRDGLDAERATDVLWLFNDPAHHRSLVGERSWTEDAYRRWLARTMHDALLPAGPPAPRRPAEPTGTGPGHTADPSSAGRAVPPSR
jgi:hypothetical protein